MSRESLHYNLYWFFPPNPKNRPTRPSSTIYWNGRRRSAYVYLGWMSKIEFDVDPKSKENRRTGKSEKMLATISTDQNVGQ